MVIKWWEEDWGIAEGTNTLTFQFKSMTRLCSFIKEQCDEQFSVVTITNEKTNRKVYLYSTPISDKYVFEEVEDEDY